MRASRTSGPRDSQGEVSLKADWAQGVNTILPPDRLPPMQFTHMVNGELREGYPVTRAGLAPAPWLYDHGEVLGEVFQGCALVQSADPDPRKRLPIATLVVCDNNLWLCAPNNQPLLLMADITEDTQPVEIIDAFDETLILRNFGVAPLRYRYEPGQFPRALPAARAGQTALPDSPTGCYTANRIWLKKGKSEVIASDIFEWDYNAVETVWLVDDGEGDEIVKLWPVGEDRIVVFKTRSVHVIEGVASLDTASDPPVQVTIRRIAAARGCVAPNAIKQRGQTLFYLSRDGIEALVLSEAGVSAMSDKPLSVAAQRYFDEVKWRAVNGAQMAISNGYLMLSVPTRYADELRIPLIAGDMADDFDDDGDDDTPLTTLTVDAGVYWDIEGGDPLVNFVEFPFWQFLHWRPDINEPQTAYGIYYRGVVRMWESGTVQMIGEAQFHDGTPTSSLTELEYKVWFGETGETGALQTVVTIPKDGAWHPVNWSGRPGVDEHCEVFYGGIPELVGDAQNRWEGWKYPDGLVLPSDPPHVWGGSAGGLGLTACGLVRDGNDIDLEWAISPDAFVTQHYIAKVDLDSTDWSYTNAVGLLNASTLFGSLGGTGSFTIPDSATVGLRILIWTGNQNVNSGTFDCGPWFRLAYAPTVQQGVDPEG